MATTEQVNILIRAKDEATKQIVGVKNEISGLSGTIGMATKAFAALGGAMALKGVLTDLMKAGIEEERQWNRVTQALKTARYEYDAALPVIQRMTDSLEWQTGIADQTITQGWVRLLPVVNNVSEAYRILAVSADIAAAKEVDLNTVVEAMIAAYQGHGTQLDRITKLYSPTGSDAVVSFEGKLTDLEKHFEGQAAANMDGFAGTWERIAIATGKAEEAVGGYINNALQGQVEKVSSFDNALKGTLDTFVRFGVVATGLSLVAGAFVDKVNAEEDLKKAAEGLDRVAETAVKLNNIITVTGSYRDIIPKAFLGEDDRAIKDIEIYKGELREVKDELISINGMAKLSTDVSIGDELKGPTWREAQEALADYQAELDATARKQQAAFNKISGAAKQVLSPLREWIAEGKSIGDAFANMGQRVKQILADMVINMLAEAIAKALGLKAALSAIGAGTGGGLFGFLGGLLPFDDRHNDSMLTREVRWMGELITRGITQGMAAGMPSSHWMQQPQLAAAAPTTIVLQFNGPVTSEQFVKDSILPVIEQASKNHHTRIPLRPEHLTGRRNGSNY